MRNLIGLLLFLIALPGYRPLSSDDMSEEKLFTTGGQGGRVIKVTNLDDSGPGSLFEAINSAGPRVVVFEVGGIIDLKGKILIIKEPNLSIAGQTAPTPGISIINGAIDIRSHDVIIQHLRIRTGAGQRTKGDLDALTTVGSYNVLIDHCSFAWAIDENCSVSGPRFQGDTPDEWRKNTSNHIQISNNIIAEGLSESIHAKGEHSKGTLIHDNTTDIIVSRNLYISNMDRNALFKGGARGIFLNNYIYNPGKKALRYALVSKEWEGRQYETGWLTVIGNILQYGPDTKTTCLLEASTTGPCKIYMEDNVASDMRGKPVCLYRGDTTMLITSKPIWYGNMKVLKTKVLKDSLMADVGARPWDRDEVDVRLLSNLKNHTGKIINSEAQVGGYPAVRSTRSRFNESDWNLKNMTRKLPNKQKIE